MCMNISPKRMNVCTLRACLVPTTVRRSLAARTVNGSEPACGFWELNLSPLQRAASAPNYWAFSSAYRKYIPKQNCNFASWIFYALSSRDDVYKSLVHPMWSVVGLICFCKLLGVSVPLCYAYSSFEEVQYTGTYFSDSMFNNWLYSRNSCNIHIGLGSFLLLKFLRKRICIWRSIWVASKQVFYTISLETFKMLLFRMIRLRGRKENC